MDRPNFSRFSPVATEADLLLADVLAAVQLPASKYAVAEGRYRTLSDWIEREGSPLRGYVARIYGQGGVSQGSSVAARATNDEFDVDAMVELHSSVDRGPEYVLDLLYRVVRGERGSRYYDVTTRCTRCIQVQYADKMHVDLTPAVLQYGYPERQSTIFHHRAETPHIAGYRATANPFGFTAWFKMMTPPEPLFALAFDQRSQEVAAKAEIEDLPEQVLPHGMSRALASLQLFKRFRNLRYDLRETRCPPSVLLAKLVAGFQAPSFALATAVFEHAVALRDRFEAQVRSGLLIVEQNPACAADVLTDRWPSAAYDQSLWLGDLNHLVRQLGRFVRDPLTLKERQQILSDLFGEHAAGTAIREFADRMGRSKELGETRYQPSTGRLILPAVGLATSANARPVPRTSYYGGARWNE
jgi:hypothetical protein